MKKIPDSVIIIVACFLAGFICFGIGFKTGEDFGVKKGLETASSLPRDWKDSFFYKEYPTCAKNWYLTGFKAAHYHPEISIAGGEVVAETIKAELEGQFK